MARFGGRCHNSSRMIRAMQEPHGYELAATAPVTRAAGVPTMVTGRVLTTTAAESTRGGGHPAARYH
jgi:hypothetical protein